jgi:hypothetical protein
MGLPRLPPDWMLNMRSLRMIDLSFNAFTEWPEEALMPHFEYLQVMLLFF